MPVEIRSEAPPGPKLPPAQRPCSPTDREFEGWFSRTFGGGYEVFHDGPDPARIRDLVGAPKAEAERMLRRGLAACSSFAVSAIAGAGWRDLIPDLEQAVASADPDFRAHAILALKDLGSNADFTNQLISVLRSRSTEARITAAMGARRFSIDRFRRPLLDRVRLDPSWLVRFHAAESLYDLADIYPRGLSDHPAVAAAVSGDPAQVGSPLDLLGISPPLTADQRARLAVAADQLDAEITARLAAGPCSKPMVPTMDDLYVIPVRERPGVALTVEETIGSCERTLAFVAFLESPDGFSRWIGGGHSGKDPLKFEVETLPKPVTVAYSRATGLLTVGTVTLDTAKANVAVLSARPTGIAIHYQGKLGLTFERHGRSPSATGMAVLDFQPEIALAIRTLLERSPELRGLVRGGSFGGERTQSAPTP